MQQDALVNILKSYQTPLYVFDLDVFKRRTEKVCEAFTDDVNLCFSIKANPFLTGSLPDHFTNLEVCSPGELEICKSLKIDPDKIIFSGVNKTEKCIVDAIDYGVRTLTAESMLHLELIDKVINNKNIRIRLLIRLTGGDQFGMDESQINEIIKNRASYENIDFVGLHYFSGTQKSNASIIKRELEYLSKYAKSLIDSYNFTVEHLEYGAGLFSDYYGDNPEESEMLLLKEVSPFIKQTAKEFKLTVEMGRFFAASCGSYLTSVADVKVNNGKNIAIVDGGIHQIGYHGLMFAGKPPHICNLSSDKGEILDWTIYGSLCSRGDILARNVKLSQLTIGDILLFKRAGAYAVTDAMSLFLSRDIPAVMLCSEKTGIIHMRDGIQMHTFNTPKPY